MRQSCAPPGLRPDSTLPESGSLEEYSGIRFPPDRRRRAVIPPRDEDPNRLHRTYRDSLYVVPIEAQPRHRTPFEPVASVPESFESTPRNFAMQPGASRGPVPLDRRRRNSHHFGGVFYREPSKKAQLHDAALLRVQFTEAIEGAIEGKQVDVHPLREVQGFIEGELARVGSSALPTALAACALPHNLPPPVPAHPTKTR